MAHLLGVLTGRRADDDAARAVYQQTGGNPLFVREVVESAWGA